MDSRTGDQGKQTSEHANHMALSHVHDSVAVPQPGSGFWKQWKAFFGPAILVSVGYMDPGNWGTALQSGAQFQYGLLWVIALASLMALILQILAARLGVACGKDLAQCCREWYPKWLRLPNWLLCEAAIMGTDLAEALGSAVALNLLFSIPLLWALVITACDVLFLLALQKAGMRFIEALVTIFVGTIMVCYFIELFILPYSNPDFAAMGRAFISPSLQENGMLLMAIGIIGATVMPHNLYLHSALVQSRKFQKDASSIRAAITFNTIDSTLALTLAFFVNAAILVLAAMTFYGKTGMTLPNGTHVAFSPDSDWITIAYLTLAPLLGSVAASTLFGIALLASGQSSTITGTLAGQVVMEGFMQWRLSPLVRRTFTRLLAVGPAIIIVAVRGDSNITDLIVLSQVVLALQLPFAMFPLLHFTSSTKRMGPWKSGWILLTAGWASAFVITALGIYALPDSIRAAWRVLSGS